MDDIFLNCNEKMKELFTKYNSDAYMFQRLQYHILTILPSTLENESKNHVERVTRNHFLLNEQQIFIQVFLSKHQYYYLPNNSCFYHYDGKNYSIITEDDIQHELLTTISKDKTLMQWKHKTKINIIKQIKDRNLFTSTPESETFQNVLNVLYPAFFSNKQEAKYFLTIIGDNMLKKNSDLIFLIKPKMKKLMGELENIAYYTLGLTNIANNFITKYHENYDYEKCRLLKINDMVSFDIWLDIIKKMGINLFCVAAHYSNRYTNSDAFIINYGNEDLRNYTFYLKNNSQKDIIQHFCDYSIEQSNSKHLSMNWKNMHYLWKLFIANYSYPSMIYSNTLKSLLSQKFSYDEELDSFPNITSKYLPLTGDFILFWENTITVLGEGDGEEEFEVDEICSLFKKWKQTDFQTVTNTTINENDVVKIISHFFPHVEIVENKYFSNIRCSLWNKMLDIQQSLDAFKLTKDNLEKDLEKDLNTEASLVSLDDIYKFYCNYYGKSKTKIASKRYFEKYVCTSLATHILFDKFISNDWFQT